MKNVISISKYVPITKDAIKLKPATKCLGFKTNNIRHPENYIAIDINPIAMVITKLLFIVYKYNKIATIMVIIAVVKLNKFCGANVRAMPDTVNEKKIV